MAGPESHSRGADCNESASHRSQHNDHCNGGAFWVKWFELGRHECPVRKRISIPSQDGPRCCIPLILLLADIAFQTSLFQTAPFFNTYTPLVQFWYYGIEFFPEFALEIKILIDITQLRRRRSVLVCSWMYWLYLGCQARWILIHLGVDFSADDSSGRVKKSLPIKTWSRVMTVELAQVWKTGFLIVFLLSFWAVTGLPYWAKRINWFEDFGLKPPGCYAPILSLLFVKYSLYF